MLVTPVLILFLFQDTLVGQGVALGLLAMAVFSDYLDGLLARKHQAQSRLGRFLDPMADKVLVLGTFCALAILEPNLVPWWAVVVLALRDLGVTGLRMGAESRGRSLRTLPIAKWKTTFQMVFLLGMVALLFMQHLPGAAADLAAQILSSAGPLVVLIMVVAFTALTGVLYAFRSEKVSIEQL